MEFLKKNPNWHVAQLHSPCFNHARPNFLKQSPNLLVGDGSRRGPTVFIIVIVHDDVRTRGVALLLREHPIVLKCSSGNSSQIWFRPVGAAYWKDRPSRRGHGGHDLTSSETLSPALWRLGGLLRLCCNPPNSLRKHNSHAGVDNMSTKWSQNIKEVNILWTYLFKTERVVTEMLMHCILIKSVIRGSLQTDSMLLSAAANLGQIQVLKKQKPAGRDQKEEKPPVRSINQLMRVEYVYLCSKMQ